MFARWSLICLASILPWVPLEGFAQACVDELPVVFVYCHIDGHSYEVPIYLDADYPYNFYNHDWGSYKAYTIGGACESEKINCAGEDYSYGVADISDSWFHMDENGNFNKDTNEAFWDWLYGIGDPDSTYYRLGPVPDSVDYSQNCHGFAFGVGDWPRSDATGVGVILKCYQKASRSIAEVAITVNLSHSIKILDGEECEAGGGVWLGEALETVEKNKESPLYYQSVGCPKGVTLDNPLTDGVLDHFEAYTEN